MNSDKELKEILLSAKTIASVGLSSNQEKESYWIVAYLQEQGIEVLDLGGVNTHDLPGISRFKLGTGGQAITLAGTYF